MTAPDSSGTLRVGGKRGHHMIASQGAGQGQQYDQLEDDTAAYNDQAANIAHAHLHKVPKMAPARDPSQLQYRTEQADTGEEGNQQQGHEQEEASGAQAEHEADDDAQVPLTATIQAGTVSMQQRKAAIEQQIDDATAAGMVFLDGIKKDFVERMKQLRGSVNSYCASHMTAWRDLSAETQEAAARADAAKQLVRSFGLQATSAD